MSKTIEPKPKRIEIARDKIVCAAIGSARLEGYKGALGDPISKRENKGAGGEKRGVSPRTS